MASISILPPLPPDVAARTGPRLLGFLFHWGLFGALCVQVYVYTVAFQGDPKRNKILVYSVFVLEFIQTVFFTQSAFYVFGAGYGNYTSFEQIRVTWFTSPILTGIVAFIVQVFYAYRIKILSQSYVVACITSALAVIQLGGAIGTGVVQKRTELITDLLGHNYWISAGIWNGASVLCNLIIASSMSFYLARRAYGTMEPTNMVLKRLTTMVIETGTITAVVAIVNLALSVLPVNTSYFLASSIILGKVYSNSMMALFNSRLRLGESEYKTSSSITKEAMSGTSGKRYNSGVRSRTATDTYGLADGIKVTREEMVFTSGSEISKDSASSTEVSFVSV